MKYFINNSSFDRLRMTIKNKKNNFFYFLFALLISCSSFSNQKEIFSSKKTEKIEFKNQVFILEKFSSLKENSRNIFILDPLFINYKNIYGEMESKMVEMQNINPYTKKYQLEASEYSESLIVYLVNKGYNVYFLHAEKMGEIDNKKLNSILELSFQKIKKDHGVNSTSILGISLGGQVITNFLAQYITKEDSIKIEKIAYIGTGFDYNYTGSLSEMYKKYSKSPSLLCNPQSKENLCNKYLTSIYSLETSKEIISYPNVLFAPDSSTNKSITELSLKYPLLIIYGKLDGISPEESIYPPFYPEKRKEIQRVEIFEASTANGLSLDYDHFDLILHEEAKEEIYPLLIGWLGEE